MADIKFSVVTTVFNEEKTIEVLVSSLFNQSLKPDEIIIVDAGSIDDTVEIIHSLEKKNMIPVRLLVKPGVNRSMGRNIGIESAKNTHIAVIDAGCEADHRWLVELASGFIKQYQTVAGFYIPVIHEPIQRLFSVYVSTLPRNFDESNYLPSSRSLAFTKTIRKAVGMYPEHLATCEDLVFAAKLKETGKMTVRRQAIVLWKQAENLAEFFNQLRGYARGDVEAGYIPHMVKILSVWVRYPLFFFFPLLFFVYILYPPVKHYREISCTRDIVRLILIQFTVDGALLVGSLEGLKERLWKSK